jgi:hypothetical protein
MLCDVTIFCCEGIFCRLLGTVLTSCDISDLWVGGARNRPGLQLAGQLWIQIVVYSLSISHTSFFSSLI